MFYVELKVFTFKISLINGFVKCACEINVLKFIHVFFLYKS